MEQLSSGKRINTASDDAAGMAIASRITSEVKGIEMAIRNSSDAQALIDTAEGAHQEVENILQRARELAVQASNDTNSNDDRASLQLEINQLLTEVDRISANTSWAGKSLMGGPKGGSSDFSFQIGTGNAAADTVKVSIGETSAVALGIGGSPSGVTGRDTGPAGMRIDGNKIIVEGTPAQGDTFEFSINDVEVDIIYSQTDQYSNDIKGVAAQLKDEIDALVAAGSLSAMTVTDNGDGTLDIAQTETPAISVASAYTERDVEVTSQTFTLDSTGTFTDTAISMSIDIDGTQYSFAGAAGGTATSTATGLVAAINAGIAANSITNFTVTDGLDGSFTINSVAGSEAPVVTDVAALATETVTFVGTATAANTTLLIGTTTYTASVAGTAAATATDLYDQITAAIAAGTQTGISIADDGAGVLSITTLSGFAEPTITSTAGTGLTSATDGGITDATFGTTTSSHVLTVNQTLDIGDTPSVTVDGTSYGAVTTAADSATTAATTLNGLLHAVSGLTGTDNSDGTITVVSTGVAEIASTFADVATNAAVVSDNIVTISGDFDSAGDNASVTINGITATYTKAASDGFDDGVIGAAAGLKQAIENTDGLENVIVTDNGDGSLTFTQSTVPVLEAAEVGLTTPENVAISYDDAGVLSVTGSFVEGQQISFDLFGETVSFTTKDEDGFNNTLAGIANQMAAAINNAGISGVTAAKTASVNSVTITADVVAGGGVTNSGSNYVVTTVGSQATATVEISGTDVGNGGTATTATFTTGDAYTFEVAGNEFSVIVGTDGYTDDVAGLSEQMKDTIDAAGIAGLVVTANTSSDTAPGVSITRSLTDTTATSGGSTIVTNIQSLATDEIAPTAYSGAIDVSTADLSANAINRIDAALLQLNAQRAELGAVSNRMDYTINNLSNVSSNLQGGLSRIQDADFAKVTGELTKSQIMSQAATAMLAQANASKQGVLSLLQG